MVMELLGHHPALAIVLTVAIVLTCGVLGQMLGRRLSVPPMLFLLALGIVLGPEGAGIIHPEVFGDGLRAVISIAVAVIVFEGAMLIDVRHLRHVSRSVLGLVTVGAATTFVLAAGVAHFLNGLPWKIAFLYGAIVSVTGPTVVTPILKRLPLTRRLKTTLEAESVLVDAVGVLLTSAVFIYITGSDIGVMGGLAHLLSHLAIGSIVGVMLAVVLKIVLTRTGTIPGELVRMIVLTGVLLGFSVAEVLAHESGIAAVAVAGLMAGSMKLPYEETIKQFKGDLTLIALNLVFILLAAGIKLGELSALGWPGLATVALLMLLVRPIAVALATWGTSLSWRERAFIAWMGPRGIVAASLASLMAIELQAWEIQGAEPIAPLVFLTILVTVLIEGSGAGFIASRLNVMPKKILIAGSDEIARRLAKQLTEDGEAVVLIDRDAQAVQMALHEGLSAVEGDALDAQTLTRAGIRWCQTLVAATPSDKANLMVCQVAKAQNPAVRLVARVNDAHRAPAFQEAGIETLTLADAAAMSLSMLVTRPNTLPLLSLGAHHDKIVEVQLGNPQFQHVPLKHLDLPKECLIALVKRGGQVAVPDGDSELRLGDTITLIGQRESVEQLRVSLESDS